MATVVEIIKMPKTITTLHLFNQWKKSLDTEYTSLYIRMKRRGNFHPFSFREENNGKISYLIDDGVASGMAHISRFNQVFLFRLEKYDEVNIIDTSKL